MRPTVLMPLTLDLLPAGDVQCFGGDCYALAFGVPAALMIVALGECPSTCNVFQSDVIHIVVKVQTVTTQHCFLSLITK